MKWWAYLHINNTVQVKRFFDDHDIQEAKESPFCKVIMKPYEARDHKDALDKANDILYRHNDGSE